jgi:hypothetical protein
MKKAITIAVVSVVGLAGAFVLGARVGVSEFLYADAQYKTAILAWQLHNLHAGRSAPVIARMEKSLDDELARHGKYMESRLAWLWPDLRADDEAAIRDGVSYRLAHPHEADDGVKELREKVLVHYKQD